MRLVEPRNPIYWLVKKLIPLVNAIFLGDVHGLEHVPRSGPFIIACNHVSIPDGWLFANVVISALDRPIWFVARDDFWATRWWTRTVCSLLPALLIDWRKPSEVVHNAEHILSEGGIIGIFPEGTRNTNPDELMVGKSGVARMALHTGVPVLPAGYQGPNITRFRDVVKHFLITQKKATLRFGEPLQFKKTEGHISSDVLIGATDDIMRAVALVAEKKPRLHRL